MSITVEEALEIKEVFKESLLKLVNIFEKETKNRVASIIFTDVIKEDGITTERDMMISVDL